MFTTFQVRTKLERNTVQTIVIVLKCIARKQGMAPNVSERKMSTIRSIIHWELAAIVLLVLCAALMAKGVGAL
jgi:uncharacterized membrane protein